MARGISLMLAPRLALQVAGITSSSDIMVARRRPGYPPLYRLSVFTRFSAPILVGAFVLATKANPLIMMLTVVDAAGVRWYLSFSGMKRGSLAMISAPPAR